MEGNVAEMADDCVDVEKNRPNIRIQIHNNLTENEKMEVDNEENEDGEIIEQEEDLLVNTNESNVSLTLRDKVCLQSYQEVSFDVY